MNKKNEQDLKPFIIAFVILFAVGAFILLQKGDDTTSTQSTGGDSVVTTETGLKYEILEPGDGAEAKAGDKVSVHYTGTLLDGSKFDSSLDRGTPFEFTLGMGQVIKGWDEGVAGMKIGETRKLTIPSDLGYGATGSPPVIPPNSDLIFEVELLAIQ